MPIPETVEVQRRRGLPLADFLAAGLATLAFVLAIVTVWGHAGWTTPLILAVPVALTWLPLFLPRCAYLAVHVAAGICLLTVIVVGLFSVGPYFIPSAVAVVVALVRHR